MESSVITVHGENACRFAETLIDAKADERRRSINKWGVRNIHTYEGEGTTLLTYERGSAHENSWLVVSVVVEQLADQTAQVAVFVGGGGRGPFKLEEISMRRLIHGEDAVGQAGRFKTVLEDVNSVCESLGLEVETRWESDTDQGLLANLEHKIFHE